MLLPSRRELPPGILVIWEVSPLGKELSIFVDESGGQDGNSKYCIMTLVLHDQANDIGPCIESYQETLRLKGLRDIPMHTSPLLYGKGDYKGVDHEIRHHLFSAFFVFCRRLPIMYKTFAYKRSETGNTDSFVARLRRDIVVFLVDNLEHFQSFDKIKALLR